MSDAPQRVTSESYDEYHERLRAFLEGYPNIDSFAVFDGANRYQINLPRWMSVLSKTKDKSDISATKNWPAAKLNPKECAAKVRTFYPHVYDDMDDVTLTRKVLAKYPDYCDVRSSRPDFIPAIEGIR